MGAVLMVWEKKKFSTRQAVWKYAATNTNMSMFRRKKRQVQYYY